MAEDIIHSEERGEIVMYQPNTNIRLEVRLQEETVWLTQQQMAELFSTTRNNITLHIGNIFKEGELDVNSVRKESLLTALDGKKYRTKFYNLDVIISVGYRVKSKVGTRFRQWANAVLKDYLLRGYAVHQQAMAIKVDSVMGLLNHFQYHFHMRLQGLIRYLGAKYEFTDDCLSLLPECVKYGICNETHTALIKSGLRDRIALHKLAQYVEEQEIGYSTAGGLRRKIRKQREVLEAFIGLTDMPQLTREKIESWIG